MSKLYVCFFLIVNISGLKAQLYFQKTDLASNFGAGRISTGDLNNDGKPDLVLANSNSAAISVYMNIGSGTFSEKTEYFTGNFTTAVSIADLNGDGYADIVGANSDNTKTLSVFTNTGMGTFGAMIDYSTGDYSFGLAIEDLNGDGSPDLAVLNRVSKTVSVLTNSGIGEFHTITNYPVGDFPSNICIGDLDGNGSPDLAIANFDNNTLSVLINTGNGTFGIKTDYTTGVNPAGVRVGDLDGDGNLDLAVANYGDDSVSIFINTGTGAFEPKANYIARGYPIDLAIGDFNGDGKPDMVTADRGDQTVSVLLNTGAGSFNNRTTYFSGVGPYSIVARDLNNDGRSDIAVSNADDYTVSVFIIFLNQPIFASFVNPAASYNQLITINGFNLLATTSLGFAGGILISNFTVTGSMASSVNGTNLIIKVPEGAISGPITLTGQGGNAITTAFTVCTLSNSERPIIARIKDNLNVNNTFTGVGYQWIVNNQNEIGQTNALHTALLTDGKYQVSATFDNGCPKAISDSIQVISFSRVITQTAIKIVFDNNCPSEVENDQMGSKITLLPNPTQGILNVISTNIALGRIEVHNGYGQKIIDQKYSGTIDLTRHFPGIYIILIFNQYGSFVWNEKVILE